ncbi:MAG: HTTM domain-containing protein [Planctomycetaceae bacterium]|nr:HTTM domain-containing protein [Planctomycetaceae bacterium]
MSRSLIQTRDSLREFFYRNESPFGLAIMRIALPLVMLTMLVPRWRAVRELFSSDGAPALLPAGYGYMNMLPEFSGPVAVALFSVLLLATVCACIGWMTRVSLAVTLVLFTYFSMMDCVSTMTKYTVIMTHVLLLLTVSECGALWSVDAWLKGRTVPGPSGLPVAAPAWPRRLIQLLVGFIYFGAAMTKMNTPTFLSGDQLQLWMLTHVNFRHPLGEWLALYPVLLKSMGYVSLVWELTFIFLVWRGIWRPIVLSMGIVFHFLTFLTLGLIVFPLTCYCTYLAFLDEEEFVRMRRWAKSLSPQLSALQPWAAAVRQQLNRLGDPARWQRPAWAAYPMLALIFAWGGAELEHWVDPYQQRRPEGPHQLKTLDPHVVTQIMAPTTRIRDKDKFFAIDTGTLLVGDLLADRRRVYRYGEQMIVQCHLTPPHEDMWVECKILDTRNRLVDRTGNVAPREAFRVNFMYPVTRVLEPGEYTLVLETAGREVLRKKVQIVDTPTVAAAN